MNEPMLKLYERCPALESSVNAKTVPSPDSTLFFLRECVDMLQQNWLHLHALPLEALAYLVSKTCLPPAQAPARALTTLFGVRIAAQHLMLGAPQLASLYLPAPEQLLIQVWYGLSGIGGRCPFMLCHVAPEPGVCALGLPPLSPPRRPMSVVLFCGPCRDGGGPCRRPPSAAPFGHPLLAAPLDRHRGRLQGS